MFIVEILVADQGSIFFDAMRYSSNMMQCVIFVKHFLIKKSFFIGIFDTPGCQGEDFAVRNPFIAFVSAKWYQNCYLLLGGIQWLKP
jgi:hypothetical protein